MPAIDYGTTERAASGAAGDRINSSEKPLAANVQLADQAVDFWLARGAILVITFLQLTVVNDLSLGPRWLAPAFEFSLLVPLSLVTAWTQRQARAETLEEWQRVDRYRRRMRLLAIVLTAIVTLMNFAALARLIFAMVSGHAGTGKTLLLDAVNIWVTNVVIFGLWFWAIDRGGPAASRLGEDDQADFIFTQQQLAKDYPAFRDWQPGFIDYLFLSFTNGTAFSPAEARRSASLASAYRRNIPILDLTHDLKNDRAR